MEVISIRTASLGDSTYIVIDGEQAIVIDPQRDIGRFLDIIDDHEVQVTHVLETHMHNDYISGGRDLAQRTGADLVLPAASGATFAFVPAFNGELLDGEHGLVIKPIHTPGHTLAHTCYLVSKDNEPAAAFTGGSLLVGTAGRCDLLGEELAHQLAVLQFGSLQRLGRLPDDTGVYPTHGEGSFCSSSGAARSTSTIGAEKSDNPLYRFTDAEAFAEDQLDGLVPYPSYYQRMGPINRRGPLRIDGGSGVVVESQGARVTHRLRGVRARRPQQLCGRSHPGQHRDRDRNLVRPVGGMVARLRCSDRPRPR